MRLEHLISVTTMARFTSTRQTRGIRLAGLLVMFGWIFFWATWGTTSSPARGHGSAVGSPWRRPAQEATHSDGWRGAMSSAKTVPLWRLNVGALGYTPWRIREGVGTRVTIGQIHFVSDERLVVTFISRIVPERLPRRSTPEGASNLHLRGLFVDAATGGVQASHEWPTFSERSRIVPTVGGKFVVITPDKLTLYSPEIQPLEDLDLPVKREAVKGYWDAVPSPAGKYLMVWYDALPVGAAMKSTLIDAASLRTVIPWAEGANGFIPLDDGNVVASDGSAIGPLRGPWRPLDIPWGQGCEPNPLLIPVSDRVLFGGNSVSLDRWCYSLALTSGEILFERELPSNEFVGLVGVSAGGERFAVETYKVHGGSWLLDIGGHALVYRIKVYDIAARRWIYALDGKKQGIKTISGLALSPDGSLLALIDQNGILQVYRVPATANQSQ